MPHSKIIYLDHNIVNKISAPSLTGEWKNQRELILALRQSGYKFALSAWHIYELVRAQDNDIIERYCSFVRKLNPVFISHHSYVKCQEIDYFLQKKFDSKPLKTATWLNTSVVQMLATYDNNSLPIDITFKSVVDELKANPSWVESICQQAEKSTGAIEINRCAEVSGLLAAQQQVINRGYFSKFAPKNISADQLEYLVRPLHN